MVRWLIVARLEAAIHSRSSGQGPLLRREHRSRPLSCLPPSQFNLDVLCTHELPCMIEGRRYRGLMSGRVGLDQERDKLTVHVRHGCTRFRLGCKASEGNAMVGVLPSRWKLQPEN